MNRFKLFNYIACTACSIFFHLGDDVSPALAATTIVGDGGNLAAAIAAAANGDTVEIHSNQTFVSTLTWQDKFLTIRAGAGFQPTIRGNSAFSAVEDISGIPGTGGLFQGLSLQGSVGRDAVRIVPSGGNHTNLAFVDNVFVNDVSFVEFSSSTMKVVLERNLFLEGVTWSGTGTTAVGEFTLRDSVINGGMGLGGTGSIQTTALVERNIFRHGIGVNGTGSSKLNALLVNNVIALSDPAQKIPGTAGINVPGSLSSTVNARFVNNTVVGFETGIRVWYSANASLENMLLYNDHDIDIIGNGTLTVTNSLLSNGTFAGVNGNIAGIPNLGLDFQLMPGSPGIDAGNNNALQLPATDIFGAPRILDGNGDSIARVDVGAYELVIPEPCSILLAATVGGLVVVLGRVRDRFSIATIAG